MKSDALRLTICHHGPRNCGSKIQAQLIFNLILSRYISKLWSKWIRGSVVFDHLFKVQFSMTQPNKLVSRTDFARTDDPAKKR